MQKHLSLACVRKKMRKHDLISILLFFFAESVQDVTTMPLQFSLNFNLAQLWSPFLLYV